MRAGLVASGVLVLGLAALGVGVATHARAFVLAQLSLRAGRPVHVDGDLSLHPALDGFTVRFGRLHVDQAAWAGPGAMLWIDRGAVSLPWTALLGDVRLEDVRLDGLRVTLRRDPQGRVNWSDGRTARSPRLPRIARLALRNGRLDYQDPGRAFTFQGAVAVASNAVGTPVLSVRGGGRSEDGVWSVDARSTTDFAGTTPYVLSGRLVVDKPSGRSVAAFSGRFAPADGGRMQGVVDGSGPDLHDLSHLINVPLPRTPPYRLHTQVDRTAKATRVHAMSGVVGASDISGSLTITPAPGGRRLDGVFHSRSLRMSDLFSVASGGHLTRAHLPKGRFLPDIAINPVPLRKLTGAIRLSAASVQAPTVPTVRSLQLLATFDHGRIAAAPMTLILPHGRAVIGFVLDVRGAVPRVGLNARLEHADTSDFHRAGKAQSPLQASFDGAIHLQGAGPSLSAAASHASGDVRLAARNGRLQRMQAAVLSGNVVQGVFSLLGRSRADTPLDCAVARFEVSDGQARATSLRMVTGMGRVTGAGGFNLESETLDLTLRPAASMMSGVTSVRIAGPMTRPRARLTVGSPTVAIGHVLSGLVHPARSSGPLPGCD